MMTIRISLPSLNGMFRDKDVDPQPQDELEAPRLRAVYVIPGDLHPVTSPYAPSAVWLMDWR